MAAPPWVSPGAASWQFIPGFGPRNLLLDHLRTPVGSAEPQQGQEASAGALCWKHLWPWKFLWERDLNCINFKSIFFFLDAFLTSAEI